MAASVFESGAKGAAAGSAFGPWGAAAGGAIGLVAGFKGASDARRAADLRATALKAAQGRRLAKGKQEASLSILQGEADKTSEFAGMLSRGVSRNASIIDSSLSEITNRADFMATQAMQDAQLDAQAMQDEGDAYLQQAKSATTAAWINGATSILGTASVLNKAGVGENPTTVYNNYYGTAKGK